MTNIRKALFIQKNYGLTEREAMLKGADFQKTFRGGRGVIVSEEVSDKGGTTYTWKFKMTVPMVGDDPDVRRGLVIRPNIEGKWVSYAATVSGHLFGDKLSNFLEKEEEPSLVIEFPGLYARSAVVTSYASDPEDAALAAITDYWCATMDWDKNARLCIDEFKARIGTALRAEEGYTWNH